MKKALLALVGLLGLAAAVPLVGGLMMTASRDITVTANFKTPPRLLYATLTDFAGWALWYAPAKTVTRAPDQHQHEVWKIETEWALIQSEVVNAMPPEPGIPAKVVTRVADPASPVQGGWEWTVAEAGDGSTVTLTDHGTVRNPLMRFLLWKLVGPKATIIPAVEGLARKHGETVTVAVAVTELP